MQEESFLLHSHIRDFPYNCSTNSSCAAHEIIIEPGIYLLEVWGAKGGDGFFYGFLRVGGAGGYSRGVINIKQTRKMYLNIGGSGSSLDSVIVEGGNNGGGYNNDTIVSGYRSASGGGATDIRLDVNDLYHRIIVAGGGGGGNTAGEGGGANGGVGGGAEGGMSPGHYNVGWTYLYDASDGTGGNQIHGGVFGVISLGESYRNTSPKPNGTFGFGGNIDGHHVMGGPGGGGWYGGGAGNGHSGAGGGGSGFVLNERSVLNAPIEYAFTNEKSLFLYNGYTFSGTETFASPQGYFLKGNNGNGYARITFLRDIRNLCFCSNRICYAYSFAKQFILLFITQTMSP
jgi:hypothetical protein